LVQCRSPLAFRIRNVRHQGTARPVDITLDDMDDWMLDNVDFSELTQLPASPPPPVFYRTTAETTDSGTNPSPAPLPPPTLAVLPLSQERIADLVSTELSARLNLRVDQVADRIVDRVRDLTLVDAAQEQTLRVAVNFAAHVMAGAADSVLGGVSALSTNAAAPSCLGVQLIRARASVSSQKTTDTTGHSTPTTTTPSSQAANILSPIVSTPRSVSDGVCRTWIDRESHQLQQAATALSSGAALSNVARNEIVQLMSDKILHLCETPTRTSLNSFWSQNILSLRM